MCRFFFKKKQGNKYKERRETVNQQDLPGIKGPNYTYQKKSIKNEKQDGLPIDNLRLCEGCVNLRRCPSIFNVDLEQVFTQRESVTRTL